MESIQKHMKFSDADIKVVKFKNSINKLQEFHKTQFSYLHKRE